MLIAQVGMESEGFAIYDAMMQLKNEVIHFKNCFTSHSYLLYLVVMMVLVCVGVGLELHRVFLD